VSGLSFGDTLDAVERAVEECGFVTVHVHDIGAALAAKGFPIQPLCIYEIERRVADADARMLQLLMPCRVNVYVESDQVVVAAIRPSVVTWMFPEAALEHLAERVERSVEQLVDSVAG
jgi:uncharacterized protein (DUF302 family)